MLTVDRFCCSSQGQSEAAQLLATFWPRQMQEIRNMNTVSILVVSTLLPEIICTSAACFHKVACGKCTRLALVATLGGTNKAQGSNENKQNHLKYCQ